MTPTITHILAPTDFSPASDAALEWAKTIARTSGASLHLLHVFEDPFVTGPFGAETYVPMPASTRRALLTDAKAKLANRLTREEQRRLAATSELVVGCAATAIVEYARAHDIDLIVMGTHGRTGMAHVLIGSVAERIVRVAPCPVLTVHKDCVVNAHPPRVELPEMPVEVAS